MLTKKYYDGFTVHDILNKHLDDGHKILELLTAFADADGVDAVEVIRCKDCKHWARNDGVFKDFDEREWHHCPHLGIDTDGYFSCIEGERKEE